MATLLSNKAGTGVAPRAVHAGTNSVTAIYSLTAADSAGDVIQMVKIPAGAVILDVFINSQLQGALSGTVGDGITTNRYLTTTSLSANGLVRATVGVPYSTSVDDTVDISINAITSATASGWIALTVHYLVGDAVLV